MQTNERTDEQTNVPNLDAMEPDDLMEFWFLHHGTHYSGGRNHRRLFPNGGKGTRKAAGDLAAYASNKATAMQCRLRGDIETALMYEGIADRIYARLPEFAKW